MTSHVLGAILEHQSGSPGRSQSPVKAFSPDTVVSRPPSEHELDQLQWGRKLNGPSLVSVSPVPQTPAQLESRQSLEAVPDQAVGALLMSVTTPNINRWRLVGTGIITTFGGLSDAATGALIPSLEKHYNVGYALVSLIFVANAVGFIVAAPFTEMIDRKIGRANSYILVNLLLGAGYTMLVCTPPFPVVVLSFFVLGLGFSIYLAMTNVFIVNLMNGTVLLGFMHALYGLGGIVSPILATTIVTRGGRWSSFYAIPLGLSVIALFATGWAFQGFEKDLSRSLLAAAERTAPGQGSMLREATPIQLLRRAFRQRTTSLGAVFILFYQGAEVAISGWVISFLIAYRDGNPAQVGYTTSGFWGGITVGRIVLTPVAARLGEKRAVAGLAVIAAALQLLVWLVPNIVGNAVAEAFVGLALGPVYPCANAVFSRLLPRSLQLTALSFVTCMGSSGGAIIPLITGLLAQKFGTVVLHPIVMIAAAVMLAAWFSLPSVKKPTE